jgi:hypothetical protein
MPEVKGSPREDDATVVPDTSREFGTHNTLPFILVDFQKRATFPTMHKVKDTLRATVRISYDGRVHKTFRGPKAEERFANEVRVLRHLEQRNCPFVPRLLEAHPEERRIVTTSCGSRVQHLDEERTRELFDELLDYGVRHDDPDMRNVTYRQSDGRFCLIDFEFATILPDSPSSPND